MMKLGQVLIFVITRDLDCTISCHVPGRAGAFGTATI